MIYWNNSEIRFSLPLFLLSLRGDLCRSDSAHFAGAPPTMYKFITGSDSNYW